MKSEIGKDEQARESASGGTLERPRPFVTTRPTTYREHCSRIAMMLEEGLHDGKRWKSEAHERYAHLENAGRGEVAEWEQNKAVSGGADIITSSAPLTNGQQQPDLIVATTTLKCGHGKWDCRRDCITCLQFAVDSLNQP